ncbi:MAG: VWA domain-containing protein [Deltaproteobacteria bacterium]|nr:VWA domain-containing protein [Deltaproteobacteria bacterium]
MLFENPNIFFLLWLLPPMVAICVYGARRQRQAVESFCDVCLVSSIRPDFRSRRRVLKALMILAAASLMILALARPQWGSHWEEVRQKGVDLVACVDVSRSMLAQDVKPSRLERARRKLIDLLGILKGDRVGLVAFAGTAFLQCPLTLDYGAFQIFLGDLAPDLIPVPGTAVGQAIRTALKAFDLTSHTDRVIILITDGEDLAGDALDAAKEAAKAKVKIFSIGIGQLEGAPIPAEGGGFMKDKKGDMIITRLDERTLEQLAQLTGGMYVRSVTGDLDLNQIYLEGIKKQTTASELKSNRREVNEDRFQWVLLPLLMLLILEGLFGEVKSVTGIFRI